MSSRRKFSTLSDIARHLAAGYGSGEGSTYRPWLYVRDVPSNGRSHIEWSELCDREHQLLSDHEHRYFLIQLWLGLNTDIRECFPLPLEETLAIARFLGIEHPRHRGTSTPFVITTDFVLTRELASGERVLVPRSIKPAQALNNATGRKRVLEKEDIQRAYWAGYDRSWALVTDRQINKTLASNLNFLYQSVRDPRIRNDDAGVQAITYAATHADWHGAPATNTLMRIAASIKRSDEDTAALFKLALWRRLLVTDLETKQLHFGKPIGELKLGKAAAPDLREAA